MTATIEPLDAAGIRRNIDALADVLADCVAGGASVSFMSPFGPDEGRAFWEGQAAKAARGEIATFAARVDGRICGSVQLGLDSPPNQPHRGEIRKMLVHRSARGRGVANLLMAAAEGDAASRGLTLLTLDTASDVAERLYTRRGWQRVGVIPDFALLPDGRLCGTTIFYLAIRP